MNRKDFLLLLFLIVFGFVSRFYRLDYAQGKPIFDELKYYREAALSYLQNRDDPNFEHPPFFKEALATSIRILGDNPYGWRWPSLLFSLIGNVVVYFFLRDLFGRRSIGFLTSLLLSFDFLYFIHSRLAVPETVFVSLSWLALYFLWRHARQTKALTGNLLLGSIFLGLALATKWSALFILIPYLFLIVRSGKVKPLLLSLFPLLITAFAVYAASYGPYIVRHGFWAWAVLQQQMFWYWIYFSQKLGLDLAPGLYFLNHAYAWILNPAWAYDLLKIGENRVRLVWALYNPLLWFSSILLFLKYILFAPNKNFLTEKGFLAVLVFSFYLPWLFVTRVEYPYYFMLGLPFLYGFISLKIRDWLSYDRPLFITFMGVLLVSACLFYPLVSGLPVSFDYLKVVFRTEIKWE